MVYEPPKKRTKKAHDVNVRAFDIVSRATGEKPPTVKEPRKLRRRKHRNAVTAGKLGGLKGGNARSKKLTPEQRSEIARIAAQARWKKSGES